MSSAILYLAIVAIWACVLVPRWLRRSHEQPSSPEMFSGEDEAREAEIAGSEEFAEGGVDAGAEGGVDVGVEGAAGAGAPDFATLREQGAAVYGDPVAWEQPAAWEGPAPLGDPAAREDLAAHAAPDGYAEATYSVTATYSAEVTYSTETAGPDVPASSVAHGGPVTDDGRVAHDGPVTYGGLPAHDGPVADRRRPPVPVHPPGPSPRVLQGRRRTLTLLITITIAAMGSAFVGLTPWWTTVPPFVMLGTYLMLLREAAHADAEHARIWAESHARAARAAHAAELARQRSGSAHVAPPPPTAEIINISARAAQTDDEPYDQYADAEIRAVGD